MPLPTRIQIAKADILQLFETSPKKLFKQAELAHLLTEHRAFWRLAQRTTTADFVAFLTEYGKLKRHDFNFPSRAAYCYAWGDVPLLEVIQFLRPRAYFSYYTAMSHHGLTEQNPKTLYLTYEPSARSSRTRDVLTQEMVDVAFGKEPRFSQDIVEHGTVRVCLVNGVHTAMRGVVEARMSADSTIVADVLVTDIERTLIDIAVRPIYAGGVTEVMKAFENATPSVSGNRLRAMLKKLDYLYPFHQVIGFYLERAGYKDSTVSLFREIPRTLDFYLTHNMGEMDYLPRWNLYVPKWL